MSMVGFVDWGKVEVRDETGGGKGDASKFMKFGPGKHRVRLLGQPYFFLQSFIPKKLTGADNDIAITSPGPDHDPLIKMHIEPQQKGAINVLHRDDGNKLKIMRFGSAIYKHIHTYAVETGIDPSDLKKGVDFLITVVDPGGNPRNRQYSVTPLANTPIKKVEADKIKADGGLHDLPKYFTPTPLEKINEYIEQYNLVEKCSQADGENTDFEDKHVSSKKGKDAEDLDVEDAAAEDDDEDVSF